MPGCVAGFGEAQWPLSTSIDWHPAETRLPSTVTGRGCSSEALSRIRQLKLLNSNNTCYLNAFVLSWLHANTQTGCTEYAAFGSRSQAWRDVLYSSKPLHVHALPSWHGILEGWPDVHRQHEAGQYTARLLPLSGQGAEITQWSTDDGRTARPLFRAVEYDPQVLVQGYVLLLCRGTCRGGH